MEGALRRAHEGDCARCALLQILGSAAGDVNVVVWLLSAMCVLCCQNSHQHLLQASTNDA
jgi:hypothetical protein